MNRTTFTNKTLAYGSAVALLITLILLIGKGIPENNILQYIVILFIPGSISSYISAHALFTIIKKRYKDNKSTWVSAFYLVFLSFLIFGFLATLANGIYEPYKAFKDLQSFFIMSFILGISAFIITSWLSIPLGFYLVNKQMCSDKQFNMDSGADAPSPDA